MLSAVALLALTLPMPAFSEMKDMSMKDHPRGHGQMMEMGNMDKMNDMMSMCVEHADYMGLTDDQIDKMKPIQSDMQKKKVQFNADLKIAEIELKEIMEVKDFDLDKANYTAKKIAEIKTTHYIHMLKAMKEMRTTMTEDQFKKMKKMTSMRMGDKKASKKTSHKHK